MKLTLRLTVTVTLMMALVMAMLARLSIDRETTLIEADIEHDVALVAMILSRAGVDDAGLAEMDRFLWDRKADRLHVQVVSANTLPEATWPPDFIARLDAGEVVTERRHHDGQEWVHATVRVGDGTHRVEVIQSLESRDAFVSRLVWTNVLAVLLTTVFGALFTLLFGRRIVGQRIDALVEQTRHMGRGVFDRVLVVHGNDEVSELGHAFNQLARDLIQVNARLAEAATARLRSQQALEHADRLRMVGQLAAGVAHEVGTPLSVIGGRAQLIARRNAEGERDHTDAGVIREQAAHISELVHRLLDYARVVPAQPQPCDLRALVAETLDLLAPEGHRGRVRVVADLPDQPVRARVDPRAMRQVLVNLVLNGIQAMERAPTPPAADATLTVRARVTPTGGKNPGAGLAEVSVIDQGPGVPEDLRPHLFEPFFTTKAPGEGTGLGLSVVDRIVTDHDGTVTVHDAPSGGAVFVVQLPALDA